MHQERRFDAVSPPVTEGHGVAVLPAMPQCTDAQLVDGLFRRRPEALTEVYERHGDAVLGLATRVLRNRSLAEDVVQELFLRLWLEPHRFDARRGSLRTFLMACASRRAIDLARSETSRRAREQRQAGREVRSRHDLEEAVLHLVASEEIREAVRQLSDEERDAVTLAYFGGHSYRQVAEILGQPEGTIKSRIRAALNRLRTPLCAHAHVSVSS